MNSNQFLTLLQKGNDLQKEDFYQLVKLHASFPYFQIPAVLAAKYENEHAKDGSTELLHKAAILSPNRAWLRSLIENRIHFLETVKEENTEQGSLESPSVVIIDSPQEKPTETVDLEDSKLHDHKEEEKNIQTDTVTDEDALIKNTSDGQNNLVSPEGEKPDDLNADLEKLSQGEPGDKEDRSENVVIEEASPLQDLPIEEEIKNDHPDIVASSHPTEDPVAPLITSSGEEDERTRPNLILPDSVKEEQHKKNTEEEKKAELVKPEKEEDKPIIVPVPSPPSSRQDILRQLEENLAKLKSESSKNKPVEEDEEEPKPSRPRRKRSGEDLIDSIKKKEKREIKDTKKKEQNDIIKAFNKKSIKMAAIKENEDVNKLQDLSLPSTKINDRMVSESYAKLLTQQGKKAAAKEIYKKLILKFPQKKAYFADLIQQLEE